MQLSSRTLLRFPFCGWLYVAVFANTSWAQQLRINRRAASAQEMAPIGNMTGDAPVRQPDSCTCDSCVSAHRLQPTQASQMKCVPGINLHAGAECRTPAQGIIDSLPAGVPYILFCQCHCQAINSSPNLQCVSFDATELAKADDADSNNCNDPQSPTQAQDREARAAHTARVSRGADGASFRPATAEERASLKAAGAAAAEAKKQYEATVTARDNARLYKVLEKMPD